MSAVYAPLVLVSPSDDRPPQTDPSLAEQIADLEYLVQQECTLAWQQEAARQEIVRTNLLLGLILDRQRELQVKVDRLAQIIAGEAA